MDPRTSRSTGIDLYWLPLGAGGHSVRWNGRVYEAACALATRRAAADLYHSALVVSVPPDSWVVEMTPVWSVTGQSRGVVAEGAVGARWAGRSKFFRYEVHCWRGGTIADVEEAVSSPRRLADDEAAGQRLLGVMARVPSPVWGRDELRTGEMWNSNSVTAWALASSGLDPELARLPRGGRAPGWNAGLVAASRSRPAEQGVG
jgi:hypothetical protein